MSTPGLPAEDGTPTLPGDASRPLGCVPRTTFRGPSQESSPFQPSLGRGATSIGFFRTFPTLPLAGSGQSPPREKAWRTEDELAGSQSPLAVHRLREGWFEKEQFLFPGRSRVERLVHSLPGPSAPVPCPSYRSPPPPHPEIAGDTRRPRASRGGGGVRLRPVMVPFGCRSADRQMLVGQGNRPPWFTPSGRQRAPKTCIFSMHLREKPSQATRDMGALRSWREMVGGPSPSPPHSASHVGGVYS